MNVEVVSRTVSKWGEGPLWYEGKVVYVDIEGHLIQSLDPVTGDEESWDVGERVGFVVPRASGGFLMGGDNGLAFFDPATREKTPIVDPEPDKKPDNRFNDGKCDPAGRVWAGTISTVKKEGDATLYRLDTELALTAQFPKVTNSNGLCWTGDAATMYYIDTPSKKVRAFDFDNATGEISNERVAIDTSDLEGSPDGMTIDENDHVWIAFCRGGCVRCFEPETGKVLDTIELPTGCPTSCAFGGEKFETLYITTGRLADAEEEEAGMLFAVKPGVRGAATIPFAG
ncbi:MAG: SMP-30/gluconolactonase/LRE family protein [Verrucomicrobiota bacterium]